MEVVFRLDNKLPGANTYESFDDCVLVHIFQAPQV